MKESSKEMTEAERAEDHCANRDDQDQWGEPVEARAATVLSVMVSARFTAREAEHCCRGGGWHEPLGVRPPGGALSDGRQGRRCRPSAPGRRRGRTPARRCAQGTGLASAAPAV